MRQHRPLEFHARLNARMNNENVSELSVAWFALFVSSVRQYRIPSVLRTSLSPLLCRLSKRARSLRVRVEPLLSSKEEQLIHQAGTSL
jgi:hypothetical protein